MSTFLYCLGGTGIFICFGCMILKMVSKMVDREECLSDKLPPFWVFAIGLLIFSLFVVASGFPK